MAEVKRSRPSLAIEIARTGVSTTLLFVAGFVLPLGGLLLMMLTPQPALRLAERSGRAASVAACGVALVAIGLAAGSGAASLYAVSFGLFAIALPVVLSREWSLEITLGVMTATVALSILLSVVLVDAPMEILGALGTALERVRSESVAMYARAGLSAETIRELQEGSQRMIEWILVLAPALFVLGLGAMGLVNVDLLRRSQRAAGQVPVFGDLTRWKCPPELVWLLIASGYGTFLTDGLAARIAGNAFAVLLAVYFCQGLVIAQFYMRRWHSPFWVNGLVYACIVVEWLLATMVMLLGVFDLWADFRRLNPRPAGDD